MKAVVTRMNARQRWLIGTSAGLVAACGALAWLSLQELPGQVRRLPDGSTLELRGTTYGTHHAWEEGSWRQRAERWWATIAPTLVPRALRSSIWEDGFIDDPALGIQTATAQQVLWFRRGKEDAPVYRSWTLAADDSHGCRLRCGRYVEWPFEVGSGPNAAPPQSFPIQLAARPRRDSSFRLFFVKEGEQNPTTEFRVANPRVPAGSVWQAPRCPAEARSGNLRAVLRSLSHSRAPDRLARSTAVLEYYEHGKPTQNWWADRVTVSDATGNSVETDGLCRTQGRTVDFDALCRFEPAWKLQAQLLRVHPEQAPADRVWRIRTRAFPRRNTYVPLRSSLVAQGWSLQGVRISGGGNVQHEDGREFNALPSVTVRGSATGPVPQLSLVRIADARGREYRTPFPTSALLKSDAAGNTFVLPDVPVGNSLDLTFAFHRTRTVEFLVKP